VPVRFRVQRSSGRHRGPLNLLSVFWLWKYAINITGSLELEKEIFRRDFAQALLWFVRRSIERDTVSTFGTLMANWGDTKRSPRVVPSLRILRFVW